MMYITTNIHTNPTHREKLREVFQTPFRILRLRKALSIHYKYVAIAVSDSMKGTTAQHRMNRFCFIADHSSLRKHVLFVLLNIYLFVWQLHLERVVVKAKFHEQPYSRDEQRPLFLALQMTKLHSRPWMTKPLVISPTQAVPAAE